MDHRLSTTRRFEYDIIWEKPPTTKVRACRSLVSHFAFFSVVIVSFTSIPISHDSFFPPKAEYCGLVKGLEAARDEVRSFGSVNVHIIVQGDSQLIIKQLTGDYQCKNASLKVYLAQARKLVGEMSQLCTALKIEYKHVLRAYNTIADGKLCFETRFYWDLD